MKLRLISAEGRWSYACCHLCPQGPGCVRLMGDVGSLELGTLWRQWLGAGHVLYLLAVPAFPSRVPAWQHDVSADRDLRDLVVHAGALGQALSKR